MNNDEIALTPPDAATVARRALALCAFTCRGFIEKGPGNPDAENARDRLLSWVRQFGLTPSLGPLELETINAPLGGLSQFHRFDATWACEGVAVLAWALGRFELPKHDEQVDPYAVTDALFFLGDD